MKHTSLRRSKGFTLIELLVVIAIIAILAAAAFTMGTSAIQKAKRTAALNVATSIEGAVNEFYREYGYLPDPQSRTEDYIYSTDDDDLILILTGRETVADKQNSKSINFLTVKEGKANKNGMIYDTNGTPVAIYDPWGGPYKVIMDYNYDEVIDGDTIESSKEDNNVRNLNAARVAVWTNGADGVSPGTGTAADDVSTW